MIDQSRNSRGGFLWDPQAARPGVLVRMVRLVRSLLENSLSLGAYSSTRLEQARVEPEEERTALGVGID
jgi:hypothetical protein